MNNNQVTNPENQKQEFSSHEVELNQSRTGRKQEMEFVELSEYEDPPLTQFTKLRNPVRN